MDLKGKTVFVTGATSGIGEACARAFASKGSGLILSARRKDVLEEKAAEIKKEYGVPAEVFALDVRSRKAVFALADELAAKKLVPDVLVNNAGLARGLSKIQDGNVDEWEEMIDTNVKGLLYVSRAILPLMVARNYGHVVNIGSLAGRIVYPAGNVYNATKFAVDALSQAMNLDLAGTNIRVSLIEPGMVKTNFSAVRFSGDTAKAADVYEGVRYLTGRDIADAVLYIVQAPDNVNIQSLLIMPVDQRNPYIIHREKNSQ
ncbi:MAG: SDR family NAD(P)-dependent oxidoreductase [Spirochaetales bacterium]|jgi:NADP-dependent 3-hydroxy acid dehydrogenase YdfG|nr:SDR family NAD(P)-dependent oxidoreductase [Spirochaetales bacterium]